MKKHLFIVGLLVFCALILAGNPLSVIADDEILIKSLTKDDIDAAKKIDSLLKDPKIEKDLEMGLMKKYCCTCISSKQSHEFKGWSWPQAIVRCMADCGGPCSLSKGSCK